MPAAAQKQKIAILGGGVGAMSTAFALTDQPGWQDRYEITVYQLGWRLGGKGASGRNAAHGQRIEEHGLHIWFGFYENAFGIMRKAYQLCTDLNLAPGSPFRTWQDAFKPHNLLTAMEFINGAWKRWDFNYLTNDELPGAGGEFLKPWDYVLMLLEWLLRSHTETDHPTVQKVSGATSGWHRVSDWVKGVLHTFVGTAEKTVAAAKNLVSDGLTLLQRAHDLAHAMPADPLLHQAGQHQALLWLLDQHVEHLWDTVKQDIANDDDLRRRWSLWDLAASIIRGVIADGVLFNGYDYIDKYDAREWLIKNGCRSADSATIRGTYDLVFAYEKGDINRPNFAAGTALRAVLRILFTYKGSITWKMQAGMGDTVFSPLYLVLKQRGVRFKFFHCVRNLGLSADKKTVDTIALDVQATVKAGEYQPLVTVKGLPCWPNEPLYDQLVEGEELKRAGTNLESAWGAKVVGQLRLERGKDFDQVVLGISLGAFRWICPELIAASPKWRDMVTNIQTVQTQAIQVWLQRTPAEMGWVEPERAVVGAYVEPLDTWADMSQVLDKESWPAVDNVRSISYYCGVLKEEPPVPFTDPTYPATQAVRVKQQAVEYFDADVPPLWPKGTSPDNPDGLDWNLLAAPAGVKGPQRLDWQYWRANIDPSELYVLSLKGTTQYRLQPDQAGFDNLYLAGDWTYNVLNLGAVESAVSSGLAASRGLCGYPKHIIGEPDK